MSWAACADLIRRSCGVRAAPSTPYKLCDFKPALGHVFHALVANYDYWAFGDIDVIYGALRSFLTPAVLTHDLITFNRTHVAGHLTLLRNTVEIASAFRRADLWRSRIDESTPQFIDENSGYFGLEHVYAIESHNTPLSPYIPWTNGEFLFPRYWYYVDGRLYNSIDGDRDFLYLHFMRYKYRWRLDPAHPILAPALRDSAGPWKLTIDGFEPYHPEDRVRERGESIQVTPVRQHTGQAADRNVEKTTTA